MELGLPTERSRATAYRAIRNEGPFEPPNQGAGRGQRIGRLSEGPEVHSTDPLKPTYYVAFRGFCPI